MDCPRNLKHLRVLICTIDEHEVNHLGMLLEKLFPSFLRHMVTIVINPKGTGKLNFARVDEYAIFCVPNTGHSIISGRPTVPTNGKVADDPQLFSTEDEEDEEDETDDNMESVDDVEVSKYPFPEDELAEWELRHARRRGGESSYREQRKNQFYPIYVDPKKGVAVRVGKAPPLGEEPDFRPVKGVKPVWPIDKEGHHRCWRYIPEKMQTLIDEGRIVLGKYHKENDTWTINYWVRRAVSKKLKTLWWEKAHDAGTHGTTLLHKLLGRRKTFPFPKSVYAVRDCLAAVVRNRPNALILDFFAGSGTTLHATCLLNADDSGSRRCVLVTNNEVEEKTAKRLYKEGIYKGEPEFEKNGIFELVTRPRCEAVVTGKRPDGTKVPGNHLDGRPHAQGFEENIEFFRIDYLDPDDVDLGSQFDAIFPSLWLAAGGVDKRVKGSSNADMLIGPTYGVLFRESKFGKFRKAVAENPRITHIWIVTDSEDAFAEMRSALPSKLITSM